MDTATATTGLRLIEAGFPCHQVGAETQREQSVGLQPPVNRLHVWWARRPLTPSRAAIIASLAPAGTDPETFVRQLGIERVQALVHGQPWTLTGKLLARIEQRGGQEWLAVDAVVLRALAKEQRRRADNLELIAKLEARDPRLAHDPVLVRWKDESQPLPEAEAGDELPVQRVMGDPAWAKAKMAFTQQHGIRFEGNPYGYSRAFAATTPYSETRITVLDPTAGGGSIPFEALRLGHTVVANELNPVATTILHATLAYPAQFGPTLTNYIVRRTRTTRRNGYVGRRIRRSAGDTSIRGSPIDPGFKARTIRTCSNNSAGSRSSTIPTSARSPAQPATAKPRC